jgi:hypothetical protein
MLRRPLPRRFFASVRWRSGLDADLEQLRSRATTLEATDARLAADLRQAAETVSGHLARLRERIAGLEEAIASLDARSLDVEARQTAADAEQGRLGRRLDEVGNLLDGESARLTVRMNHLLREMQPAKVWADILFSSTWSSLAPLTAEPRISIVLPTRNRPALLRRAVRSVLVQTYPWWELIVVNDAGTRDAAAIVEEIDDHRVRLIDANGSGAGHARNAALLEASGSIVAFLDDDNLMAPGWLRAVAVAFQDRPDLNALYGAQLRCGESTSAGERFLLFVSPFDWPRLIQGNFIDLGVVAHRKGLEGIAFDESLTRLIDWDYVVQLASRFGIEPLPVVASFYTTDAPMRISERETFEEHAEVLRRRFRETFGAPAELDTGPANRDS